MPALGRRHAHVRALGGGMLVAAARALRACPGRKRRKRMRKERRSMVSKTVSRGPEAGQHAEILAAGAPQGRSRGRGRWIALGVVVVVAAGTAAAWRAGGVSPAPLSRAGQPRAPPRTKPA